MYITGNKDRDNDNVTSYMYVDRPVFIIPMITFHPGHILVDILEQVYGAMIKAYGRVRRILSSFSMSLIQRREEYYRRNFPQILGILCSIPYPVLRRRALSCTMSGQRNCRHVWVGSWILTELPILSIDALNYVDMNGKQIRLLFSDVHVGL